MILRLAWRELLAHSRMSLVFMLNLAIGLTGLLLIDTMRGAIDQALAARSRDLLGADVSISARRVITPAENKQIETILGTQTPQVNVQEMYSMVIGPKGSRLVQVVSTDPAYPFYGKFILEPGGSVSDTQPLSEDRPSIWIPPDLAASLGAAVGSTVRVGESVFTVTQLIREDTAANSGGLLLASRVYIGTRHLAQTQMIRPGSTVTYRQLYKLTPEQPVEDLAEKLNRLLNDPAIRVTTHKRASQMVGRLQGFLNDYLGLAALVGLFLAAIGAAYVYRGFLVRRVQDMAILISLGLDPAKTRSMVRVQLVILGTGAAVIACLLSSLLAPLAIHQLGAFLPLVVTPQLEWVAMGRTILLGAIGSVLIGAPLLGRLKNLSPASLFQENASPTLEGRQEIGMTVPAIVVFWLLAVWESHSWRNGSLFVAVLLGAAFLLAVAGHFLLKGLAKAAETNRLSLRLVTRHLSRQRFSSISGFLAIGLGTFLLNLVPQIQKSLSTEVMSPGTGDVPAFFLFDIQPEQLHPLENFVKQQGYALQGISPLIRGRLMSVNGQPFEKEIEGGSFRTREDENEGRFRNRGFNLTWRAALTPSEKIVAGRDFSPSLQEIPEISVEQRFAKRLKLKLGDVMNFDVQGIDVSGRIVNFRSVQWTSFQPNFFVQFQPGVLEEAPGTFIASIGGVTREEKRQLQDKLVPAFPNVSIIDVSEVVARMLAIITQMAWAIRAMAFLALGAGFVVLFSIAQQQAWSRKSETLLLKVLGADLSFLQRLAAMEFGGLGSAAALAGALLSMAASWIFSQAIFDQAWALDIWTPVITTLVVTVSSLISAVVATAPILRQKPWALLQEASS